MPRDRDIERRISSIDASSVEAAAEELLQALANTPTPLDLKLRASVAALAAEPGAEPRPKSRKYVN